MKDENLSYKIYKVVLFDFGGVIAEEGFKQGLEEIAKKVGLPAEEFFKQTADYIFDSGYALGKTSEATFWDGVRSMFSIQLSNEDMRAEILSRFLIRPWMLRLVDVLKNKGLNVSILSDQTQWLDELNEMEHFYLKFDEVFNSYHLGKGKQDHSIFGDVASKLNTDISQIIFIDDNQGNVQRAISQGMTAILYVSKEELLQSLSELGLLSEQSIRTI